MSHERNTDQTTIPVIETMPADLLTPLAVYLKLANSEQPSFLFESVEGGESVGRYSFIGVQPEMIVRGNGHSVTITDSDGERPLGTPMFEFLREHMSSIRIDRPGDLPPFLGGGVGYLGFDCATWFEPTLATSADDGYAEFMFFRSIVAFDHARQLINVISLPTSVDVGDEARQRALEIRSILETSPVSIPETSSEPGPTTNVRSNWEKEDFEDAVREIKELINAGECYQAVISQCFSRQTSAHPVAIYRAVRSLNPSPYMFLVRTASRSVIGASPEMLIKCIDRHVEYRPIAGTRRRSSNPADDARLAEEMKRDAKEVAEHLMLVDLGRNDLGRVAEYGTVKVDALMRVEKYSHVQHLVSSLSAKLRPEANRLDALAACFPAGTVSGAPKVRAIEIIRSLEPTPRGIYAGAVGYLDYGGNLDMCIAIRTLVLENGVATVQAGAGIVADSVPEMEFEETVNKARAMLKAIELAEERGL